MSSTIRKSSPDAMTQAGVASEHLATARPVELGLLGELVGYLLRLTYSAAYSDFSSRLGDDALRPGDFSMITLIHNNPGITQVDLGRAAGRDKSSVTKALRQMEDAGLVRRERVDTDRRSQATYMTPAGHAYYARLERGAIEHGAHIDALIGVEKRRLLVATLQELKEKLAAEAARR